MPGSTDSILPGGLRRTIPRRAEPAPTDGTPQDPTASSTGLWVVGKVGGTAIAVVRFRLHLELHDQDRLASFEHSAGDPMHAVHDPAVDTQDDRVRRVDLDHQAHVLDDLAHSRHLHAPGEPVVGIQVPDGVEGNLPDGQPGAQLDETVDIPGVKPLLARPEVVLLSHLGQSDPSLKGMPTRTAASLRPRSVRGAARRGSRTAAPYGRPQRPREAGSPRPPPPACPRSEGGRRQPPTLRVDSGTPNPPGVAVPAAPTVVASRPRRWPCSCRRR